MAALQRLGRGMCNRGGSIDVLRTFRSETRCPPFPSPSTCRARNAVPRWRKRRQSFTSVSASVGSTSPSSSFGASSGSSRPGTRLSAARRRSEHRAVCDDGRMLLTVDVGNTSTVFGLFDSAALTEHWRIATERHKSGDELGALYKSFLDLGGVDGICLSSTVPQLIRSYHEFAERYTDAELLEVGTNQLRHRG